MRFGGVVLCGGKSTRMGYAKAWLPFGNEVMLQRVVRLLSEVVSPIVVVAAPQQVLPPLPASTQIAVDRQEGRGPLEGLRAGLSALVGACDAAYVASCDSPQLAPAFVRRMIDLLGDCQIAVPREGALYHPLAAVYRLSVLPMTEALLAEDRLRPVYLFEKLNTRSVPLELLREVDPQLRTLANLNCPEDYANALEAEGLPIVPVPR
jgi:molybdopterin-guanine dinucleotide biosynthesis protein A